MLAEVPLSPEMDVLDPSKNGIETATEQVSVAIGGHEGVLATTPAEQADAYTPVPVEMHGELALVWERNPDGSRDNVGFATFRDLVAQSRTLELLRRFFTAH